MGKRKTHKRTRKGRPLVEVRKFSNMVRENKGGKKKQLTEGKSPQRSLGVMLPLKAKSKNTHRIQQRKRLHAEKKERKTLRSELPLT